MKFSIVTPVYNGEKYIAETIESILSQEGDFEIEYIVQDGGSTDGTLAIVKSYEEKIKSCSFPIKCNGITFTWFSEKDSGMYDAVEKGFSRAKGDVFAYLNADDRYVPGAFATVSDVLKSYPEVKWLKGINKLCNEHGNTLSEGACRLYRQNWLQKGVYGRSAYFVDQESVFWKRTLWEKASPHISSWRLAGDYALWTLFAKHTSLWSFNKHVSIFRRHSNQLSASMDKYRQEQKLISPKDIFLEKRAALFFSTIRLLHIEPNNIFTQIFFFVLFPFTEKEWYIDFDAHGHPVKKLASSFVV